MCSVQKKIRGVLLTFLAALLMQGCGNSGSNSAGGATGLAVAEKVSVVDTSSSSGASMRGMRIGLKAISSSSLPANSDYNNDDTTTYVEERSAEAFDIINEILCSFAQTGYTSMMNLGDYKAQIDLSQCSSSNDSASGAGQSSQNQSSGSNQPDYETWTVNSARADAASPHIVKLWIHEQSNGTEPEKLIEAKLTITEAVSATNPYGLFTLNFLSHPASGGNANTSQEMFKGFLKTELDSTTGQVLLKFIVDGGFDTDGNSVNDMTFVQRVTLNRAADGSTGTGSISDYSTGSFGTTSESYNIAFNLSNFRRVDASNTEVCLSRTTFDETAWRYGLYDSAGARVTRNSGFPVKYTSGGTDYYGWIGYWGLWFPNNVTPGNGDTLNKLTYSSTGTTETPYTLFKSSGKLIRHTRKTATLGEIKSIPLQWHDQGTNTEYQVEWNGTNFVKTASLNQSTWLWQNISPQTTLDLTALDWTELNFWSNALGGSVQVKLGSCSYDNGTQKFSCSASDATSLIYYLEDMVYPTETIPATLACFESCPDPANLTAANPFFDTSAYQFQNLQPSDPSLQYAAYTFDSTNMVLKSSGTSVVQSAANSAYSWGIRSGPLFELTSANLSALACDYNSNQTCAWQARSNLTTFYSWETGLNDWNKFTALTSGGTYLTFDPPLPVKYTHTWSGGTTSTFYLEYGGFGELWGIPGKCVDQDTGADTACGPSTRWIPEFSIAEGANMINGVNNTTEYIVKPLEKEQRMSSVAASNCSGLSLSSYTLPVITDFTDPDLEAEPAVSGAPAVIGGVLQ